MQRMLTSALMRLAVVAAALTLQQATQAQTRELATKGELLDRVAAIVNDGVVLNSELEVQVETVSQRLRQQKLELPPQNVLRQQVLERLVLQEIQMQRANQRRRQGVGRDRERRAPGRGEAQWHDARAAARRPRQAG